MRNWRKHLYFVLGLFFLALAYIGILLPGVPAIPFILLAGWLFLKSSDKLYNWMMKQRVLGKVLKKFNEGNVSKKTTWFVISQYWVSIVVAQFIFTMSLPAHIVLNCVGIVGSIIIYKLINNEKKSNEES